MQNLFGLYSLRAAYFNLPTMTKYSGASELAKSFSQIVTKIRKGDFKASTYFLEKHHPEYTPKPRNQPPQKEYGKAFNNEPMSEKEIDLLSNALTALKERRQKENNPKINLL
jgi:hypothetical protein